MTRHSVGPPKIFVTSCQVRYIKSWSNHWAFILAQFSSNEDNFQKISSQNQQVPSPYLHVHHPELVNTSAARWRQSAFETIRVTWSWNIRHLGCIQTMWGAFVTVVYKELGCNTFSIRLSNHAINFKSIPSHKALRRILQSLLIEFIWHC